MRKIRNEILHSHLIQKNSAKNPKIPLTALNSQVDILVSTDFFYHYHTLCLVLFFVLKAMVLCTGFLVEEHIDKSIILKLMNHMDPLSCEPACKPTNPHMLCACLRASACMDHHALCKTFGKYMWTVWPQSMDHVKCTMHGPCMRCVPRSHACMPWPCLAYYC